MMYLGRFFTSKYNFDRYIPMIPKKNSCSPPMKITIQARLGQPLTGSPNTSVFTIIIIIVINAIRHRISPMIADITKGVVENANIPSIA